MARNPKTIKRSLSRSKKGSRKHSPQRSRKHSLSRKEHPERSEKRRRKLPPPGEPFGDDNIELGTAPSGFPPFIKVKDLNEELNGKYIWKDSGGEGMLYLHTNKKYILKLLFSRVYDVLDAQLKIQQLAKKVAPTIRAHVSKENPIQIVGQGNTYGYIMDYLKKPLPLDEFLSDNTKWKKLYELLYELIYNCELKLGDDWLGYTGDHLFLNGDNIFIIDFGNITNQDGSKTSKTLYESALKDVVDRVNIDIDENLFIEEGLNWIATKKKGGKLTKKSKRRLSKLTKKNINFFFTL
uniref:Protein kinase domain-containing protein n=1 Tax=Megaviridae environmental sample TaxID=1737588 RepID=A0A5J6VLV8_9VIRU|nr:MAG: hypothetical protein [Megaviridae environmental sample]